MPLPPSMSRASAVIARALRVLCILASPATVGVSRPASARRPADLGPFPVRADDRHDLLVDELLADGEEVRPQRLPEVRARHLRHGWFPSAVRSASRNACTAAARRSESAASSRWPPW